MLEECANKLRVVGDFLKLLIDPVFEFFTLLERVARDTCSFGMAPHQLIGVEVGRVAWQEVQGELALRGGNILFDDFLLHPKQGHS